MWKTDDEPDKCATGVIHVVKSGVWGGAPWDAGAYAARHPTFPTDSPLQQLYDDLQQLYDDLQQLYDDEESESYRALGTLSTAALLDHTHGGP